MSTMTTMQEKTNRGLDEAEKLMHSTFGFATFREGQKEIVGHLLAGSSALAVFPTGAGKSLCYQLPALLFEGLTLVVSPLIALMKDQIDFLQAKGVAAARLDSTLSGEEARAVWQALRDHRLRLLYVAPERFGSERFLQQLRGLRIDLMVIDEAHCISEWGHNFRPDYLKLADISSALKAGRVLTLTATATPKVAEDIVRGFSIAPEAYVNTGFYRPNLTLRATPCSASERDQLLVRRIHARPRGATVVYVTLQKTSEDVAGLLAEKGLPARAYHAGMEDQDRHDVQDWFMASPDAIVVATIAFGMGIDKADIRYVYHYNLPKSQENYMQEIGRAGRDGGPSSCDLLVCPDDVTTLENFSYGDTPDADAVEALVHHVLGQEDRFDISVYELANRYDIRTLVVSTLLTYLELKQVVASTGPFYNEYRFQPNRSSADILAGVDPDRADFLRRLLARSVKGRTWFTIDVAAAVEAMDAPRERIVGELNQLEERGDITLKVAGVRRGYRFVHRPDAPNDLIRELNQRFEQAEARDIDRIAQMMQLGASTMCIVRRVLAYFGEELGRDCGHCDRCLGEAVPTLPERVRPVLNEEQCTLVEQVSREEHEALRTPRQRARFLCGLTSPAAVRAKLTRSDHFGALSGLPFRSVLEATGV